jgi:hypothetical protein
VLPGAIDIVTQEGGELAAIRPPERFPNSRFSSQQFFVKDRAAMGSIPISLAKLGFEIMNGIPIPF